MGICITTSVYERNTIILPIESKQAPKCCPQCGHAHLVKNGFRTRDFISLPIGGKKVILRMKVRRYKCKCTDCDYDCQERIFFARAVTIRAYRTGIPAWYDCSISTGKVEGINNKIKVMRRVPYGFRDERSFRLGLYALHDCRITPNVGWTFFCVFATYCSFCFQICIMPVLRGGFTRAYMRASGGFLFFAFTPSPVCPKSLSKRKKRVKVFVLLPSHAVHHSGSAVKVRQALSLHPKMVEIVCVVVGR